MIKIEGVSKRYGEKQALKTLSLEIPSGTIFGLLGPNGAGKTTLISILNGLTPYDSGEIHVFDMPLKENIKAIRKRCALIPQTLAFYENLSIIENLRFFGGIQNIPSKRLKENIEYAIETNRLGSMLKQRASTLSGGQKRRLNIAIGLLNDPDILFFDEPTVGIDPESRNEILETIVSFKADHKTVVYTSHYMPEIEKICDEVAIINAGEIVRHGDMATLLNNDDSKQTIVEIHETPLTQLHSCCLRVGGVKVINASTLILDTQASHKVAKLLEALEDEKIKVRTVRYGTTTLESLFISLTSKGRTDV